MFLSPDVFTGPVMDWYRPKIGEASAQIITNEYMQGLFEKGLSTTGVIAVNDTTGGDSLKLQDLTKQIQTAALQAKYHARFLHWTTKQPCFSDVIEKTLRDGYGGFRGGGFINPANASGGLTSADPSLTRETLQVKWLGGQYQAFRTLLAVQSLGIDRDPITRGGMAVVSDSRLQQLMLDVDYQCLHGDPALNAYEMQGAISQIRVTDSGKWVCRFNMNGKPLNPNIMPDIEEILQSKGGFWTDFWWSPTARSDFRKQLNNQVRIGTGEQVNVGVDADKFLIEGFSGDPEYAKVSLDIFLNSMWETVAIAEGPQPPPAPTSVTATPGSTTALNYWGSYLPAGIYNYSANCVGINGRSLVTVAGSVAVPNGTQSVSVAVVLPSSINTGDVAYVEIYRGNGATGTRSYLGRVAANAIAASGTATYVDNNEFMPGCTTAMALTNRKIGTAGGEILYRQLYPTTKVVLPNNVMAEQGAWLTAGTIQVLVPQFCLVIENIGRLSSARSLAGTG